MNQGAWNYVRPRVESLIKVMGNRKEITYAGRKPSSTTATGHIGQHYKELDNLLNAAFE